MVKKKKFVKIKPKPMHDKCPFGKNPKNVDYKDFDKLKKYTSTRGRILPATQTGISSICQRKLALSLKRARFMALLPFVKYQ